MMEVFYVEEEHLRYYLYLQANKINYVLISIILCDCYKQMIYYHNNYYQSLNHFINQIHHYIHHLNHLMIIEFLLFSITQQYPHYSFFLFICFFFVYCYPIIRQIYQIRIFIKVFSSYFFVFIILMDALLNLFHKYYESTLTSIQMYLLVL